MTEQNNYFLSMDIFILGDYLVFKAHKVSFGIHNQPYAVLAYHSTEY